MTATQVIALAIALVLVVLAGLISCAEAALSSFSGARADELLEEDRGGAASLQKVMADRARYLNTVLFARLASEIFAIVLVAIVLFDLIRNDWVQVIAPALIMLVVSYVAWGVAPRTLGRQHSDQVALSAAGPIRALTAVMGPLPRLLILVGNALTPGKGFREGPFSSEAELREMVDMAELSQMIESDERKMIQSVFELDDTVVREVMVPRTDMVHIEEHRTLRQAMSLFLRSGFSRVPVTGDGVDDVVGILFFKDVSKRIYDDPEAQTSVRVRELVRPAHWCPETKPVDEVLQDMQLARTHLMMVVDEFGGTAGMVTLEDILEEIVGEIRDEFDTAEQVPWEWVDEQTCRVSARLPVDELGELFGLELDDDSVDSVGGLIAKELNRVPIPGAKVRTADLELVAERAAGRRNRISTVLVTRLPGSQDDQLADAEENGRP
ncbi:MAG TPA: HlyC/CorC family transporter [Candidatus Avipropionibacterium avicola]|uniref:HlyC/CorC family transporter n=1 Tax=Candidatus Avipropionibacterium avicola TaxID=2840701 RepID=A0A9D1GWR3_9ACTN|nr:HlyC/CorC family transporter [Candidatus Avipropionibacterium avicola]